MPVHLVHGPSPNSRLLLRLHALRVRALERPRQRRPPGDEVGEGTLVQVVDPSFNRRHDKSAPNNTSLETRLAPGEAHPYAAMDQPRSAKRRGIRLDKILLVQE